MPQRPTSRPIVPEEEPLSVEEIEALTGMKFTPSEEEETPIGEVGYARRLGAIGTRIGGGILSGIVGAVPSFVTTPSAAAIGAGSEALAQKIEGADELDKTRVGAEAALSAIPFSWIYKIAKGARTAANVARGAAFGVGSNVVRRVAEGESALPQTGQEAMWDAIAAGLGGGAGYLTKGIINRQVDAANGIVPPAATRPRAAGIGPSRVDPETGVKVGTAGMEHVPIEDVQGAHVEPDHLTSIIERMMTRSTKNAEDAKIRANALDIKNSASLTTEPVVPPPFREPEAVGPQPRLVRSTGATNAASFDPEPATVIRPRRRQDGLITWARGRPEAPTDATQIALQKAERLGSIPARAAARRARVASKERDALQQAASLNAVDKLNKIEETARKAAEDAAAAKKGVDEFLGEAEAGPRTITETIKDTTPTGSRVAKQTFREKAEEQLDEDGNPIVKETGGGGRGGGSKPITPRGPDAGPVIPLDPKTIANTAFKTERDALLAIAGTGKRGTAVSIGKGKWRVVFEKETAPANGLRASGPKSPAPTPEAPKAPEPPPAPKPIAPTPEVPTEPVAKLQQPPEPPAPPAAPVPVTPKPKSPAPASGAAVKAPVAPEPPAPVAPKVPTESDIRLAEAKAKFERQAAEEKAKIEKLAAETRAKVAAPKPEPLAPPVKPAKAPAVPKAPAPKPAKYEIRDMGNGEVGIFIKKNNKLYFRTKDPKEAKEFMARLEEGSTRTRKAPKASAKTPKPPEAPPEPPAPAPAPKPPAPTKPSAPAAAAPALKGPNLTELSRLKTPEVPLAPKSPAPAPEAPTTSAAIKVLGPGDERVTPSLTGKPIRQRLGAKEYAITFGKDSGISLERFGDYLFVDGIHVAEGSRRQGIATRLYDEAMNLALKNGRKGLISRSAKRTPETDQLWNKWRKEGRVSEITINGDRFDLLSPKGKTNAPIAPKVTDTPEELAKRYPKGSTINAYGSNGKVLTHGPFGVRVKFTSGRMVQEQGSKGFFDVAPKDIEMTIVPPAPKPPAPAPKPPVKPPTKPVEPTKASGKGEAPATPSKPPVAAPKPPADDSTTIAIMRGAGADKAPKLKANYEAQGYDVAVTKNPNGTVDIVVTKPKAAPAVDKTAAEAEMDAATVAEVRNWSDTELAFGRKGDPRMQAIVAEEIKRRAAAKAAEAPKSEAPARVYKGDAGQFFTNADSANGYVNTRAALAGYSDEQLAKARHESLKGSFDKVFGHHSKRMLGLIDDEIANRPTMRSSEIYNNEFKAPTTKEPKVEAPAKAPEAAAKAPAEVKPVAAKAQNFAADVTVDISKAKSAGDVKAAVVRAINKLFDKAPAATKVVTHEATAINGSVMLDGVEVATPSKWGDAGLSKDLDPKLAEAVMSKITHVGADGKVVFDKYDDAKEATEAVAAAFRSALYQLDEAPRVRIKVGDTEFTISNNINALRKVAAGIEKGGDEVWESFVGKVARPTGKETPFPTPWDKTKATKASLRMAGNPDMAAKSSILTKLGAYASDASKANAAGETLAPLTITEGAFTVKVDQTNAGKLLTELTKQKDAYWKHISDVGKTEPPPPPAAPPTAPKGRGKIRVGTKAATKAEAPPTAPKAEAPVTPIAKAASAVAKAEPPIVMAPVTPGINDLAEAEIAAWKKYGELKDAGASKEEIRAAGKAGGEARAALAKAVREAEAAGKPVPSYVKQVPPKPKPEPASMAKIDEGLDSDALAKMTPEEKQSFFDKIAERLKKSNNQKGITQIELMTNMSLGGLGALAGAAMTPDAPVVGAMLGLSAGFGAPMAIRGAIKYLNETPRVSNTATATNSATPSLTNKAYQQGVKAVAKKAEDTVTTFMHMLPDYYRANLLTSFSLPINAWVGPYGGAVMGAIEYALAGDSRGLRALRELRNPKNFSKEYFASWREGASRVLNANERAEGLLGKAGPQWFRKAVVMPAQALTAGDIAARRILMKAGFTEAEARTLTLTSEPFSPYGKGIGAMRKSLGEYSRKTSILSQMLIPFYRTSTNQMEQGLIRFPILGTMLRKAWKTPNISAKRLLAQNVVSGGSAAVGYALGLMVPVEDQASVRYTTKFINNFGGVYGSTTALAFIAGQAAQRGKGLGGQAWAATVGLVRNDLPMPTTDAIWEAKRSYDKIMSGEDMSLPSGSIPLIFKNISDAINKVETPRARSLTPNQRRLKERKAQIKARRKSSD